MAAVLFTSFAALPLQANHDHARRTGVVFTMSNAADGNRILVFTRKADGRISPRDSFPTGGAGTGAGLGNQAGLVLTSDREWLLAVNAGSAEVSLFEVVEDVLVLRDIVPSGGAQPLSIAVHRNLVYVLNGGGTPELPDNITGFTLSRHDGRLTPIPDSTRPLSAPSVGPAQVGFNPWGNVLVVTEKMTNLITTFTVGGQGVPSAGNSQPSAGATPFGFEFDRAGRLFVSEAAGGAPGASTTSSYAVNSAGVLTAITPAAATNETAACWVLVHKSGRYLYTTNTGDGTLSGFRIRHNGAIELLDADGVTGNAGAGSGPIDLAQSDDGRFVYSLNAGNSTITGFRVRSDGSLDLIETQSGLPAGSVGLAAR